MKSKKKKDICEITYNDRKNVASVRKKMRSEKTIHLLSETFKVLGDPTRVKIIFALSQKKLCVCDIANLLGATKSTVSHQSNYHHFKWW